MVPIVMEEGLKFVGLLEQTLGDCLYLTITGDLNNERYVKEKIDELVAHLDLKGNFLFL